MKYTKFRKGDHVRVIYPDENMGRTGVVSRVYPRRKGYDSPVYQIAWDGRMPHDFPGQVGAVGYDDYSLERVEG